MSTDLLIDIRQGGQIVTQAISIKYGDELDDTRVIEKLELEHRFWEGEQVEWFLFTENEVPKTLVQNIKCWCITSIALSWMKIPKWQPFN